MEQVIQKYKIFAEDENAAPVLQNVAKRKKVELEQLLECTNLEPDVAEKTLGTLMDADLIGVKKSTLPRWNTYYVTADGLSASRQRQL